MQVGLRFSFAASEGVTAFFTLFGTDLVVSPERTVTGGDITGMKIVFDVSPELEAAGANDVEAYDAILRPVDVTTIDVPPTIDDLYLSSLLLFGTAIGELSDYNGEGRVILDETGTTNLATSLAGDHVTVGGTGRYVGTRDGNDVVRVQDGAGNMRIALGEGDDTAYGGAGDDRIFGQNGDDVIHGGEGADVLNAGNGNDIMYGGASRDVLRGGSGNDVIYSNGGDDVMLGGADSDVLVASGDGEQMFGGGGVDAFAFIFGGPEQSNDFNAVIRDFQQGRDKIWMGGTGNSTHSDDVAYALFVEHAVQRDDAVVMRETGFRLVIQGATLDDFTVDDFINGDDAVGYFQWADSLA